MAENDKIRPYLGYIEEVEFESLREQCQDKMQANSEVNEAQDAKLSELENKVAESAEVNAEQDTKLAEGSAVDAEQNAKFAELEGKIAENNEADAERDAKFAELEVKVAENAELSSAKAAELEGKIAENAAENAEQNLKFSELDDNIANVVEANEAQNTKILALENRIAALEAKEMVNDIDNMIEGDNLELSLPSNVVLKSKPITIKPNTNVVMDLNGKSIIAEKLNVDAFSIEDGGTLTINGNENSLVETANGGNGYPIITNGKVVINGGYFKSNRDAENLTNACVYARGNGQIEVYGGRFETADGTFVLNKKDADRATTSIKVFGGEFVNFDPSDNASEIPHENFVAEGYKVESYQEGENTIYKVVKE